jgi:hypothetical protein
MVHITCRYRPAAIPARSGPHDRWIETAEMALKSLFAVAGKKGRVLARSFAAGAARGLPKPLRCRSSCPCWPLSNRAKIRRPTGRLVHRRAVLSEMVWSRLSDFPPLAGDGADPQLRGWRPGPRPGRPAGRWACMDAGRNVHDVHDESAAAATHRPSFPTRVPSCGQGCRSLGSRKAERRHRIGHGWPTLGTDAGPSSAWMPGQIQRLNSRRNTIRTLATLTDSAAEFLYAPRVQTEFDQEFSR